MVLVRLIEAITSGELDPGEALPREEDLAERFDVSRGVSREAIRALEERGLVAVKHGRGATVNERSEWDVLDPEVLTGLLAGPRAGEVLDESIECRLIVETEAAALAAERARDEDRAALAGALQRMTYAARRSRLSPGAEREYREAELSFDRALTGASGNPALARVAEPIQRALEVARPATGTDRARLERGVAERERIFRAIERGEPEDAREAMRSHLLNEADALRKAAHQGWSPDSRATTNS
jgi:DNA-binding FadR family transcriptional regulator